MSTNMQLVQWGVLAVLCYGLLAAWADVGAPAFLQRLSTRLKFLFGVICIAGMLAAFIVPSALVRERISLGTKPGKPLNLTWKLRSFPDGREVSLESLKGKSIFLNIWATWCGPCVREMPSIEALYRKCGKADGVAFVLVSQDQDLDKLQGYIRDAGITAPVYLPMEQPPQDFVTQGIPATFIIDKSGSLEHGHLGEKNWDDKYWVGILTR